MATREGYRWFRGAWQPSVAEQRVLDELAAGGTNADIAVRLALSTETVKWHLAQLLGETGCADREELARWWRQGGGRTDEPGRCRSPLVVVLKLAGCAAAVVAVVVALVAVKGGTGAGLDLTAAREVLRRLVPAQPPAESAPPLRTANARRVLATVSVGGEPFAYLGVGGGSVWVPNGRDGSVSRIDTRTNTVTATIDVGGYASAFDVERAADPAAVVVSGDEVWVSVAAWRALMRIDPRSNTVVETIDIGVHPYVIAIDDDDVWAGSLDGVVVRIDRRTRAVVARFAVARPTGIVVRPDAVWVGTHQPGSLIRIDPHTNTIAATIALRSPSGSVCSSNCTNMIAADDDAVWVPATGALVRIDPRTNAVAAIIALPGIPWGAALAGDSVWVGNTQTDEVHRIDPRTNTVVESVPAPGGARGAVAGEGSLWVPARRADTVLRIDPQP